MNLSNAFTNLFTYFTNSIVTPTFRSSLLNHMDEKPATLFTTLAVDFPDVNNRITTESFLKACSGLQDLLDSLGKAFEPIVYDMRNCIGKLSEINDEDPILCEYLLDMVLVERSEGGTTAMESLLWLRRSMEYIGRFFQLILEDSASGRCSRDLSGFLKKAYAEVLEQHQFWLGYQMNQILSKMTPSRNELFYILAGEQREVNEQSVIEAMRKYNNRMVTCAQYLASFYVEYGLERIV